MRYVFFWAVQKKQAPDLMYKSVLLPCIIWIFPGDHPISDSVMDEEADKATKLPNSITIIK
ncbi:hypothetical protein D3C86_1968340 [compost metagenome]